MVTLFPLRFSALPLFNHGEAMPESLNLKEMPWDALLRQIRDHPDPKVRQDATRIACERVWGGYTGDESHIPMRIFEPEE